ncbi:MAG: ABC transporter permease, partial [Duncaniella sp.]|nr:ABC transporter permease [Duncaniella sp.]
MKLTYLRQAWQLLRQNKLFSAIYIVGTALAIASTTIFAIIYYARLAPIYPEYQRDRMAFINRISHTGNYMTGFSVLALDEYLYNL